MKLGGVATDMKLNPQNHIVGCKIAFERGSEFLAIINVPDYPIRSDELFHPWNCLHLLDVFRRLWLIINHKMKGDGQAIVGWGLMKFYFALF